MRNGSLFRLSRPAGSLPGQNDLDPCGRNLDAQHAWKHFGGLSIQQAYDLFMSNPLGYQEDFMFMGSKAFEYYLPVIDRYLREVSGDDEMDDCEASILGSGVAAQCDWHNSDLSRRVIAEIGELSAFVLANLRRYSPSPKNQRRIERAWTLVEEKIAAYRNKGEQGPPQQVLGDS